MDENVVRGLTKKNPEQTFRIVTVSGQDLHGTLTMQPDGATVFIKDSTGAGTYVDTSKIETIATIAKI